MIIALWVLNGILALVFLATGLLKLVRPKRTLAGSVQALSTAQVKLIGLAEVAGALGLILPLLLNLLPALTPLAAVGLAITMLGAAVVHRRRKESQMLLATLVLALLAIVSAVLGFLVVF